MAGGYLNFVYNAERGFLFAYVPKVACTNWKGILRALIGASDWTDPHIAHDRARNGLTYLDLDGTDAALLHDPAIRRYAMVRDPFSRTLSAYLNKIRKRLPIKPEGAGDHFDRVIRDIEEYRCTELGAQHYPEISFEVFLLWLRSGHSPFARDEHWESQVRLLCLPEVSYDILGRFENLRADVRAILDAMGSTLSFPGAGFGPPPTEATKRMGQFYTPACVDLVREIYAEDFDQLGY